MAIGLIWKVGFLKRVYFRHLFFCHLNNKSKIPENVNKISHWVQEIWLLQF